MRTISYLLRFLSVAIVLPTTVSASDLSTGLWHLLDDEQGSTVCYMVNTGDDSWRVYSAAWQPLSAPEFAEEGSFRVILPFQQRELIKIHVEGALKGDRFKGTWQIKHIQFQESGTWTALRISPDPEWKPWAVVLRNQEKIMNLTEQLAGSFPFSSFSDFEQAWQSRIEDDFYAVLTSTVYVNLKSGASRETRDELLRSLYRTVMQDSRGVDVARTVAEAARQVHEDLRNLYPWYELDARVLSIPTGKLFDFRHFDLPAVKRRFFVVSTDWAGTLPENKMKSFLAQAFLYAALREMASFPLTISSDIALRGIVAHLSRELGYLVSLDDLLSITKEEEKGLAAGFDKHRKLLLKNGSLPVQTSYSQFLDGESRRESYYLGYQFALRLFQSLTVQEFLKIDIVGRFLPQLNDFLSDESVTPLPLSRTED